MVVRHHVVPSRQQSALAEREQLGDVLTPGVRAGDPANFAGTFRGITASLDPSLRLQSVRSLDDALRELQLAFKISAFAISSTTLSVLLKHERDLERVRRQLRRPPPRPRTDDYYGDVR